MVEYREITMINASSQFANTMSILLQTGTQLSQVLGVIDGTIIITCCLGDGKDGGLS